jgi:Icc-related predicted phosphoesterase
MTSMVRVAAVGDIHVGTDSGAFSPARIERLHQEADLLLLAGDLTQHGYAQEVSVLTAELRDFQVPIVAVLGNHDYHQGEQAQIRGELERVGVRVLEGESTFVDVRGLRVGIAGVKGFGGGFAGACGSEFGEEEMKAFMRHSRERAMALKTALDQLECDLKIALMHFSPTKGTLLGERLEIYPFLGCYQLGEAVDTSGCSAAFHGHAHAGSERSLTPGGVPVRNVARPVIKLAYKVYTLRAGATLSDETAELAASLG